MTYTLKEVQLWANKLTPEDFHNYFKFKWLYGSNFGNKWWCFNNFNNLLIERLYVERLSGPKTTNTDQEQIKKTIKEKVNLLFPNKSNTSIQKTNNIGDDKTEKEIKSFVFDDVYFEDSKNTKEADVNIEDKNKQYYEMALELLYSNTDDDTLHINGTNYRIDLDKLLQLNTMFPDKKRSIKRLSFENITSDNLIDQMKLNSIKGISGLPFS